MPIIKPKSKSQKEYIRIKIDSELLQEIRHYCSYAGFNKCDEFFAEAAIYILAKDKEFKEVKDGNLMQQKLS
jgi:hypothetical protein